MTDEIRLAFAHPEDRAAALTGVEMLDRISVRDHLVEVEIGAFQAERGTTQRVSFNIAVEVLPLKASAEDDVDRILSYDKVTEAIAFELAAERLNLLETLAERVAERILLEPQAKRVFVRIEKLDRGPGALGVEIVRERAPDADFKAVEEETQRPLIVYLTNAALASENLTGWITQLSGRDEPLVICVGPHELAVPETGLALTQLRIDLLAIEQNAWVLATRDKRCVVVETRTELDWAMKNGQICVWAPSKIVLDAVGRPQASPNDAMSLAQWFAAELQTSGMIAIGNSLPENLPFPTQSLSISEAAI